MRRFVLITSLLVSLFVAVLPAAADPPTEDAPACVADPLVAMDDGCTCDPEVWTRVMGHALQIRLDHRPRCPLAGERAR